MSNRDTNFKEYDPKRDFSNPENRKDRGENYDEGKDFDPTHGHDDVTDEHATTDLAEELEEEEVEEEEEPVR